MAKRRKLSSSSSKKSFTKNALKIHSKNGLPGASAAMRGGIRF